MRSLVLLVPFVLTTACDLQPPKPQQTANKPAAVPTPAKITEPAVPAAPVPANPTPAGSAANPAGSGSAAGSAAPGGRAAADKPVSSDACVAVGAHIAEIVIASITDEAVKAQQEQDRTRLVKRVAETCTRDKWPDAAHKCFLASKTPEALEACGRTLAPAAPPQ